MLEAGFLIVIVAMAGAVLGSFASVLVTRFKTPYAFISTNGKASRSACPSCKTPLRVGDLIPVISWLVMGGRCRHCQAPIPRFYLYLELFSMAVSLFFLQIFGFGWGLAAFLAAQPFAIASVYLFIRAHKPPAIYLMIAVMFVALALFLQYANQQTVQDFAL